MYLIVDASYRFASNSVAEKHPYGYRVGDFDATNTGAVCN